MNANFIMPEFVADRKINTCLLDLYRDYPECVQEQTSIYGFYGNFPNVIWNGGRVITGINYSKQQIKDIFSLYNDYYNLPLRLTFTNPMITDEKYCYDLYANLVAECGHNGRNEILVASPLLEEYLRKNYPNYKYCRSILAAQDQYYDIDNYHMTVINKNAVNDFKQLLLIHPEKREKIEILCNDACIDNCPRTYEHYRAMGLATLNYQMTPEAQCTMFSKEDETFYLTNLNKSSKYVSKESIIRDYLPIGYKYFKLCGRENKPKRYMNWLKYIFKYEYQEDILKLML